MKNLNIRLKTAKLLNENIQRKLRNIGLVNYFLDMTIKAQVTKEKLDKQKSFSIAKETINAVKRQTIE